MKMEKAIDSCFVAAYRLFRESQQSVINAIGMLCASLMFYLVDMVAIFNYTGLLAHIGRGGRVVIFAGGLCISIVALVIYFVPRASRILGDASLESSQYRPFRYVLFCLPAIAFFVILFLQIRFPRAM